LSWNVEKSDIVPMDSFKGGLPALYYTDGGNPKEANASLRLVVTNEGGDDMLTLGAQDTKGMLIHNPLSVQIIDLYYKGLI
jgi:hypothetical protein